MARHWPEAQVREVITVDTGAPSRRQLAVLATLAAGGAVTMSPFVDELADVDTRFRVLVCEYEDIPLTESLPRLDALYAEVVRLSERRVAPAQRRAAGATLAHVEALRADALFNTDRIDQARRLAEAAYRHGRSAGDALAVGYARKIAGMIELYEEHPESALRLAMDGQRRADGTPVAIAALALQARAMAVLPGGRPDEVARIADRAIGQAFALPAEQRGTPGGEDPGAVHPVEVAYHGVIAAAAAGDHSAATDYADVALPALTAMNRPGFVAVALAHLAAADARRGDVESALDRAGTAFDLAPRPFRAVGRPLAATLFALRAGHANADGVQAFLVRARAWKQSGSTT